MSAIHLIFPFAPVAWQRVKRGRYGNAYVPAKTARFKQDIGLWASKYISKPLLGPISLSILFILSSPKKKKNDLPITRPDLDNYCKGVMDALNGIAWSDDSQVVHLDARKLYNSEAKSGPRIVVSLKKAEISKLTEGKA